jgi:hypothetical protein
MGKKKKKADAKPSKKAKKPVDFEDDYEEEEEYSPEEGSKPKLDIYVGLSSLTLVALISAAVFFFLDFDAGKKKSPNPPTYTINLAGLQGGAAPRPGPGPAGPGQ